MPQPRLLNLLPFKFLLQAAAVPVVLAMGSWMSRFSYQPLAADEIRVVEFDEEKTTSPTVHIRLRHIKRPGGEANEQQGRVTCLINSLAATVVLEQLTDGCWVSRRRAIPRTLVGMGPRQLELFDQDQWF